MQCNKCSSKMTLLFMSYVCDTCDPPKNNTKVADYENGFKYYVLWSEEVDPNCDWQYLYRENLFEHDLKCVVRYPWERVYEVWCKTSLPFNETIVLHFNDTDPSPENVKYRNTYYAKVLKEVTDQVDPEGG